MYTHLSVSDRHLLSQCIHALSTTLSMFEHTVAFQCIYALSIRTSASESLQCIHARSITLSTCPLRLSLLPGASRSKPLWSRLLFREDSPAHGRGPVLKASKSAGLAFPGGSLPSGKTCLEITPPNPCDSFHEHNAVTTADVKLTETPII